MKKILLSILLLSTSAYAGEAHVHGAGKLDIAFDAGKGKVEFEAPSESIVGFEHEAKSAADKKKLADAIADFETSITKMVQMDPALGCQFEKEDVAMKIEGKHAEFVASFHVVCNKNPNGSALTVDFSRFSKLAKLEVLVLSGGLQKSAIAKKKPVTIDLK